MQIFVLTLHQHNCGHVTNVAVEPLAYHMLAGHESSQPDRDSNHHGEEIRHYKLQVNRLAKGFPHGESKSFHQR